jgi:two-component system, LytTR family, response regulator
LLKPITFERFFKAMEKASTRLKFVQAPEQTPPATNDTTDKPDLSSAEPQPSFIFVKDGTTLVKIRLADIKYIEGMKDYVAIHTPQKKFVVHQRMKNMETMLPADRFIRIHHSYIVSLDWIDAVQKERVQLGNISLPISDSYLKAFRAFIGDNM